MGEKGRGGGGCGWGGEGIRQGKKLSKTSTWFSLLYIKASFGVVILLINAQLLNV